MIRTPNHAYIQDFFAEFVGWIQEVSPNLDLSPSQLFRLGSNVKIFLGKVPKILTPYCMHNFAILAGIWCFRPVTLSHRRMGLIKSLALVELSQSTSPNCPIVPKVRVGSWAQIIRACPPKLAQTCKHVKTTLKYVPQTRHSFRIAIHGV